MTNPEQQVVIVPCSGIGKSLGSVGREAAYELCEDLRPADTRLVALSKLVMGDNAARQVVAGSPAVTIDGCKQMCAAKMVKQSGGHAIAEVSVVDVFRRHKDFKPEGVAELNEGGVKLAHALALEVLPIIDQARQPGSAKGADHG
ncbi:MAG: putative zinc-binding protein [Tepidisphaerales bacterium]